MKLYHGTNVPFTQIDLSMGVPYKDFGKGFYLTPNVKTAERMAKKRMMLDGGKPFLLTYKFDEELAKKTHLKIKRFRLDSEWLEFVNLNRNKMLKGRQHNFDIVIGPIANDGVAYLLGRWNEGTMTLETVLEQLRGRFLDEQYYFGTEEGLECLNLISCKEI